MTFIQRAQVNKLTTRLTTEKTAKRNLPAWLAAMLILIMLAGAQFSTRVFGQQYNSSLFSGLHWRSLGPFRGGRVNAVTGVPGQPNTLFRRGRGRRVEVE
jgi:hypothetical protein